MIAINGKIWQRVDTSANWTSSNPVLEAKEQGFDSTAKAFKIGDGVTAWNSLPYYYGSSYLLPTRLPYPIGESLPIIIDYTPYVAYGNDPEIQVKYKTGQIITSSASIDQGDIDSDITTLIINAADDGTGVTDGDIIIVIKQ